MSKTIGDADTVEARLRGYKNADVDRLYALFQKTHGFRFYGFSGDVLWQVVLGRTDAQAVEWMKKYCDNSPPFPGQGPGT